MDFGFAAVPTIVVLCYLAAEIFKIIFSHVGKAEDTSKYIPAVVGVVGMLLGIAIFYLCPSVLEVDNVFTAAAIGVVSGLGSTGANQVVKQLKK